MVSNLSRLTGAWLRFAGVPLCLLALARCASVVVHSDEDLIRDAIGVFRVAFESQDLAGLMESVSLSFYDPEMGDRDEVAELLKVGLDQGYLQDAEATTENMNIVLGEDRMSASVYPVTLEGPRGAVTVRLILGKEEIRVDDVAQPIWRITGVRVDRE